ALCLGPSPRRAPPRGPPPRRPRPPPGPRCGRPPPRWRPPARRPARRRGPCRARRPTPAPPCRRAAPNRASPPPNLTERQAGSVAFAAPRPAGLAAVPHHLAQLPEDDAEQNRHQQADPQPGLDGEEDEAGVDLVVVLGHEQQDQDDD